MGKKTTYILAAVVISAAALYFSLTHYRTINPDDEGYLIYNCLKVAEGQVPHRDFYDDYGPAVYWLGGSLFKLFGTKLIVIRIFVLALKTAMALLIFLIGRKLLPPVFALLAALLFIVSWGNPYFPAFNILYAGFVSHFLALAGMLFMIAYVERGRRLWLLGTAACLGASALFKFHAATQDFIAFAVFLSLKEQIFLPRAEDAGTPSVPAGGAGVLSRLPRAAKLLGAPVVALFYLALFAKDRLDAYYFFVFLFPYFLLLAYVFISDVRLMRSVPAARPEGGLKNCYVEILTLLGGMAAFISLVLLYYYKVGGLEELMHDTFALPMSIEFFKPMKAIRLTAGLAGGVAVLGLIFAWGVGRLREKGQSKKEVFWAACLLLVLLLPAALFLNGVPFETWQRRAIFVFPSATLMLSSFLLFSKLRKERAGGRVARETLIQALVLIFACQGYMGAFVRADPTHVQVNNTVIYVLAALILWQVSDMWGAQASKREKVQSAILAAVCAAMLATPFIWSMTKLYTFSPALPERLKKKLPAPILSRLEAGSLESYPELELDFPRSRGLKVTLWPVRPHHTFVLGHKKQVIEFIRENTERDEKIFVMASAQMIYFLSERDNFIQKENYFLYLAAVKLIDNADRVRLTDEQFTRRLAEERPRFIIRVIEKFGDQTQRIADIWPNAAEYIDANYERAARFGVYEALQPKA